jgi:hypothetical protein
MENTDQKEICLVFLACALLMHKCKIKQEKYGLLQEKICMEH